MLLGHCQAVCDLPAAAFMPELVAAYPDAKVVVLERPVDAWYESVLNTIDKALNDPVFLLMQFIDPAFLETWIPLFRSLWTGLYGENQDAFEMKGKEVYRKQYEELRALVPPDRLYEMDVEDGWEGLCSFLGDEVPDTPYPRLNDGASFNDFVEGMKIAALERAAKLVKE